MFKIGDFSKLTRVSVRMLRYYDEVGLFKPIFVDDFTSYRYYSAKQIKTLNLIVSLRDLGFNVSDITLVINESSEEKQKEMLISKQNEIQKKIDLEQHILKKINIAINNFGKERINMSYNVNIKPIPSYKVISYRQVIPTYGHEGILWGKLSEYVQMKGIRCGNVAYATYHDDGYREKDVDVEVVMEVEKLQDSQGDFIYKETEGIKEAACVLFSGDYSGNALAFNFIGKWLEENGYSMNGKARELIIKGPWTEQNPEDYLTEIQMPICK